MTISDLFSAKLKAKEIIKSLYIEDASDIDIEAIAMERGVVVKEGPLKGAEGRLSSLGTYGLITVKNDIPELGRKRFVIAHELGHFELHCKKKATTFSCSETDFNEWLKTTSLEVEANHFAAELLMPENIFRKELGSEDLTGKLLQKLTAIFHTSMTATSIRYVNVRPEYALVFSENKRIKWYILNKDAFPYYLHLSGNVHPESMAHDFFHGKNLPHEFIEVSPEAWLSDYRFINSATVKELAIGSRSYNHVLSFIYIDKPDEAEEDDDCRELDGYLRFR